MEQNNQTNKPVTIYDIAKEAGVSAATVSRVLTNNAKVSEEKRQKVEALIAKYHFQPNALAKGLSETKRKVIGVVAADVRNPYYADLFVAVEVAAREAGYSVTLYNSLGETEQEKAQMEALASQRVDAIIQLGGRADDYETDKDYAHFIRRMNRISNIPIIVTGKIDNADAYRVSLDAEDAIQQIMEYLLSLGHRKIAWIGGGFNVLSTRIKFNKYKDILAKNNIEYREDYVYFESYNYESGMHGVEYILQSKDLPTAIIAINDFSAAGVLRALSDHGIQVPRDMSVVAYDNTYISDVVTPKLTTVDYHYSDFGKLLVDTAIERIEGKETDKIKLLKTDLLVKESTAKPR